VVQMYYSVGKVLVGFIHVRPNAVSS
jgi:hypothetical protein